MSEIKTNKISPRKGTTQTIGDSGDTLSIACGATLSNAGTISTAGISGGTIDNQGTITGLQGVINWDTTAKTTNFNASSQTGYFVNTTSGAITVTFPASPNAGDVIGLKDYANNFDTNKLIIDPNGNKIQGSTGTFEVTVEGTSTQFIYVDATRGWVLTDASKASDIIGPEYIVATGGTVTEDGDYKIHTFTSPGTFTVCSVGNPFGGPNNVDYLVVAGGGGGGNATGGDAGSGGGGAGGFRTSFPSPTGTIPVTATGYPITVGGGGAGSGYWGAGSNGAASIFSSITSTGGGGGGSGRTPTAGKTGGSGGGGSYGQPGAAGNTPPVSPPQGNPAGNSSSSGNFGGGGGGGAGAAGSAGTPGNSGGPGGVGLANSITGSPVFYAGGGGATNIANGSTTGGTGGGGPGGGGAGSPGTVNTGGGGGASGNGGSSGVGGSGIVIIRYKYQ